MPVIRLDFIATKEVAAHMGRAWLKSTGNPAVCVEYRGIDHAWRRVHV